MAAPENRAPGTEVTVKPNPNWYSGNRWRFDAKEAGVYRLHLNAESGQGVSIGLTYEQAANLLYAAQAGELDDYGDHL